MRREVVIKTVINGMTFDGAIKDPMSMAVKDALIGFIGALTQAQAEANKEAQREGADHAGTRDTKVYFGQKPSFTVNQILQVISMNAEGKGITRVSKALRLSRAVVYRIQKTSPRP